MAVTDYSATPASNTAIAGINIAENCPPGNVNNAIRQLMADLKTYDTDVVSPLGDGSAYQPLDASLTALAALVTAANKGIYFSAADTPVAYDVTAYGRTLAGLADAAALRTNIGAVTITAQSLTNPGYVKINIGGTDLMLQWGSTSCGGNATATVTYSQSFATFGILTGSGGPTTLSQEGDVHVTASGLSSGTITNTSASTSTFYWLAIGV